MPSSEADYGDIDLSDLFWFRDEWIQKCDVPTREADSGDFSKRGLSSSPVSGSINPKKRPRPKNSPTKASEEPGNSEKGSLVVDDDEPTFSPHKQKLKYSLSPQSTKTIAATTKTHNTHVNKLIERMESLIGEDRFEQVAFLELCKQKVAEDFSKVEIPAFSIESIAKVMQEQNVDADIRDRILESLRVKLPAPPTQAEVAAMLGEHRTSYGRHLPIKTVAEPLSAPNGRPPKLDIQSLVLPRRTQQLMQSWAIARAPVHSGTKNDRTTGQPTVAEAYKDYLNFAQESSPGRDPKTLPTVSESHFGNVLHEWSIHSEKFDKYACPKCRGENVDEAHKKILKEQTDAFRQHKEMVVSGKAAFLITDYARIHEIGTVKMRINGKEVSERMKLSCLAFVLVAADSTVEGGLVYRNFDFFSARKQRTDFFEDAIDDLWDQLQLFINYDWERIFLWADGGMQTAGNLTVLAELQKSISRYCIDGGATSYPYLQANFYAPYHGHNVCDGHFGQIKTRTRHALIHSPRSRKTVLEAAKLVPRTQATKLSDSRDAGKKEKVVIEEHGKRYDGKMITNNKIKFKNFSCCMFDPCSPAPFILYKNSLMERPQSFTRASIQGTMATISKPVPEGQPGDLQPWFPLGPP